MRTLDARHLDDRRLVLPPPTVMQATLAHQTATTSHVTSITDVLAGDLIVGWVGFNGTPGTVTAPSGYQEAVSTFSTVNNQVRLYTKWAEGNEASITVGTANSVASTRGVVVVRYARAYGIGANVAGSGGSITPQTVPARNFVNTGEAYWQPIAGANRLLVTFAHRQGANAITSFLANLPDNRQQVGTGPSAVLASGYTTTTLAPGAVSGGSTGEWAAASIMLWT